MELKQSNTIIQDISILNNSKMFYFFHGTSLKSFEKILDIGYIWASAYLDKEDVRMCCDSKYVFTNIYVCDLCLTLDEKAGLGKVTILIDSIILKYKLCYFNRGWFGETNEKTIILNNHMKSVIKFLQKSCKYPYILSHEALFKKRISIKFIIGIICEHSLKHKVQNLLTKHGMNFVKIFEQFPKLIC